MTIAERSRIIIIAIVLAGCSQNEDESSREPETQVSTAQKLSDTDQELAKAGVPVEVDFFKEKIDDLLPSALSMDERFQLKEAFFELAKVSFVDALIALRDFPPGANRSEALSILKDHVKSGNGLLTFYIGDLLENGYPEDWVTVTTLLQQHDSELSLDQVVEFLNASEEKSMDSPLAASFGRVLLRTASLEEALQSQEATGFGAEKDNEIQRFLFMVASQQHPESAIQYIEKTPPEDLDGVFLARTVQSLANENPDRAKEWVVDQAETLRRPELAGTLTRHFLHVDPIAASRWAGSLSSGPLRDQAAKEIIKYSSTKSDNDSVIEWLEIISDPNFKTDLAESYLEK